MPISRSPIENFLKKTGIVFLFFLLIYLFGRTVFFLLLPFAIALTLAKAFQKPLLFLQKNLRLPRSLCSGILVVFFYTALGILLTLFFYKFYIECRDLWHSILKDPSKISDFFAKLQESLWDILPSFIPREENGIVKKIGDKIFEKFLENISGAAGKIISFLSNLFPNLILFLVVLFLSTHYSILDYERIKRFIIRICPQTLRSKIPLLKETVCAYGVTYIKALLILFVINFVWLLFGFSILRLPYAFTGALIVAALDILPILGTGTALIPAGILCLLEGHLYWGFGLLILYLVTLLARQLLTPHLLRRGSKTSPLLNLIAMYAGYQIFGILGLFLAPLVIAIWSSLLDAQKTRPNP